jgi:hypothetical protein
MVSLVTIHRLPQGIPYSRCLFLKQSLIKVVWASSVPNCIQSTLKMQHIRGHIRLHPYVQYGSRGTDSMKLLTVQWH